MIYYVDANAWKSGDGSAEFPFKKIQMAADLAMPGDEIVVKPGVYRENVNPVHAGEENGRIVYRSEQPLGAVITGADPVKGWENVGGTVWKIVIPNSAFGDYNPYTTLISGDWYNPVKPVHTGEVFLNGKSLYEVVTLAEVEEPIRKPDSWDPDFTVYTWYTTQENGSTVIYANFQGQDPNAGNVEINVRRNCFYPEKTGVNYITLKGFKICKAATNWAPPTAYQEGMVGPHWSKGWIIEDCEISHSRCSGISLGKYLQPENDNKWTTYYVKDGTQTERENICQAVNEGWNKDNIGSHIIRRCNIHDCGQTGIVGHLGGVFSIIEDNDIHHINNKQNLAGAEIAGIKMHAAIDVIFRRNHFHHCTRGLWLDWQAQGTRVTQNLFDHNTTPEGIEIIDGLALGEDVWIEVSHGPTLLDNNVMLSQVAGRLSTQGIAYVNNLICGSFTWTGTGTDNDSLNMPSPRYTPYHVPHSTAIAGFMTILHGDARFYNNIFVQQEILPSYRAFAERIHLVKEFEFTAGTNPFDDYPTAEEYFARFNEQTCRGGDAVPGKKDFYYWHLPVYTGGNVYFNGARPCKNEADYYMDTEHKVYVSLKETEEGLMLDTNLYEYLPEQQLPVHSTASLGMAFEPEEYFENPDGSEIIFDRDYFDNERLLTCIAGPFANASSVKKTLF